MALIGAIFAVAVLNVVDVGRYAFIQMQIANATQAGAQAASVHCDPAHTPATISCPALTEKVIAAIQSTSLGADVTLNGVLGEGWYCVTLTKTLQYMSPADAKPLDCSGAANPAASPALYLQVRTAYAYAPLFPGMTVAAAFPAAISRLSWMRMA